MATGDGSGLGGHESESAPDSDGAIGADAPAAGPQGVPAALEGGQVQVQARARPMAPRHWQSNGAIMLGAPRWAAAACPGPPGVRLGTGPPRVHSGPGPLALSRRCLI